jgi:hypothetical protein
MRASGEKEGEQHHFTLVAAQQNLFAIVQVDGEFACGTGQPRAIRTKGQSGGNKKSEQRLCHLSIIET